jgi:hypothetical protein
VQDLGVIDIQTGDQSRNYSRRVLTIPTAAVKRLELIRFKISKCLLCFGCSHALGIFAQRPA